MCRGGGSAFLGFSSTKTDPRPSRGHDAYLRGGGRAACLSATRQERQEERSSRQGDTCSRETPERGTQLADCRTRFNNLARTLRTVNRSGRQAACRRGMGASPAAMSSQGASLAGFPSVQDSSLSSSHTVCNLSITPLEPGTGLINHSRASILPSIPRRRSGMCCGNQ